MSESASADMTCPRCSAECVCIAISASRGRIMVCDHCVLPIHDDTKQPLLWFYDSSRLWESFDEPEGEEKPCQVKVIRAQKVENIDYHPDYLPPG